MQFLEGHDCRRKDGVWETNKRVLRNRGTTTHHRCYRSKESKWLPCDAEVEKSTGDSECSCFLLVKRKHKLCITGSIDGCISYFCKGDPLLGSVCILGEAEFG